MKFKDLTTEDYGKLPQSDKTFLTTCVDKVKSSILFKGGEITTTDELSSSPFENILTIPIYWFLTRIWVTPVGGCVPYNPWYVKWGVSNGKGKRRRALFWSNGNNGNVDNYLDGFGFNNLYFAWSMKLALGFDEVLCVDTEHWKNCYYDCAKNMDTNTQNTSYFTWLTQGATLGDSLFLFITAHGNNRQVGDYNTGELSSLCESLPAGVNILISANACGVVQMGGCKLQYYSSDIDNVKDSTDDSVLSLYESISCPDYAGPAANVVTLTEHHDYVDSWASANTLHMYSIFPKWNSRGYTAHFLSYIWTNVTGTGTKQFIRNMTWRQMVVGFTDEYTTMQAKDKKDDVFHPTIGVSHDTLLDQPNFIFLPSI